MLGMTSTKSELANFISIAFFDHQLQFDRFVINVIVGWHWETTVTAAKTVVGSESKPKGYVCAAKHSPAEKGGSL